MTMFSYREIAESKQARRTRRTRRFAVVAKKYQRQEGEEQVNKRQVARQSRRETKHVLRSYCN